jgi:GNAT superfamily N-acetyltransferase
VSAGLLIRPFDQADRLRLQEILEAAFAPVFASFRNIVGEEIAAIAFAAAEKEQAELLDKLCAPESGRELYVAERHGEIAGFCAVSFDRETMIGEIDLNAVHPDHQGEGLGERIYAFALERMKETGMKIATVGTGGDEAHAPARRAYEKAGFTAAIPSVYYYKLI